MLHKLRRAMVRPGRDLLSGEVEVDETLVGGASREWKPGRGSERKSLVVVAVEVIEPRGFGRIRMRVVPDASAKSLLSFAGDVVERGSSVHTDGWPSYGGLEKRKYRHRVSVLSNLGDPAHEAMPGVHRVASLLKRWLLGTHQGSVEPVHLQAYLDEFTFRFNRTGSRRRGLLFYRLAEQAVAVPPVTYRDLTSGA